MLCKYKGDTHNNQYHTLKLVVFYDYFLYIL